ncbi:hypothetical protein GJ496_010464 [Pomphorhynchus laevis]|nr:hypothetical protein GJ496_010464 [Pomphorhynchus laevis]
MNKDIVVKGGQKRYSILIGQIATIVVYGLVSLALTISNKIVLTELKFPSAILLAFFQTLFTFIFSGVYYSANYRRFPLQKKKSKLNQNYVIILLPILNLLNVIYGLKSIGEMSLPMFIALRRFSILFTLILERIIISKAIKKNVIIAVVTMITGAIIATSSDIRISMIGCKNVLLCDVATASLAVIIKRIQLQQLASNHLILTINSVVAAIVLGIYLIGNIHQTVDRFNQFWITSKLKGKCFFFTSCSLGYLLNYAVMLCTEHNSALTTSIVGTTKNILVTYIGMFIGGDYRFTLVNFTGLNISAYRCSRCYLHGDRYGLHALSYQFGGIRHDSTQIVFFRAAQRARMHMGLETRHFLADLQESPADILLTGDPPEAVDLALTNTLQPTYVSMAGTMGGSTAHAYAERVKCCKYKQRVESVGYNFMPAVVESFGRWNDRGEALVRKIATFENRVLGAPFPIAATRIFQEASSALMRGSARAILALLENSEVAVATAAIVSHPESHMFTENDVLSFHRTNL